jgi:hypothetical protein
MVERREPSNTKDAAKDEEISEKDVAQATVEGLSKEDAESDSESE